MTNSELYARAVELWGPDAQLTMLAEECCECGAATLQFTCRGRQEAYPKMIEEIADVEVMIEQARAILGNDLIDAAKARKLERLQERIEHEVAQGIEREEQT